MSDTDSGALGGNGPNFQRQGSEQSDQVTPATQLQGQQARSREILRQRAEERTRHIDGETPDNTVTNMASRGSSHQGGRYVSAARQYFDMVTESVPSAAGGANIQQHKIVCNICKGAKETMGSIRKSKTLNNEELWTIFCVTVILHRNTSNV